MSSSLFRLFRHNPTFLFGLFALLLVSTPFFFAAPATSADSYEQGEGKTNPSLYSNASRAALSKVTALAGSELIYSPGMIEETMLTNERVTNTITLTNSGALEIEFELDVDNFAAPGMELVSLSVEPLPAPSIKSKALNHQVFSSLVVLNSRITAPPPPSPDVALILDDGSTEASFGVAGGQFVWLNRFTPDQYPFSLTEVAILFGNTGVDVGDLVDIYVYEDTDGDGQPGTNAMHLASINNAEIQANDRNSWSVYEFDTPVLFSERGDALIAVVYRTVGIPGYPAELDTTASQGRSWVGIYAAAPADPPTFPADYAWLLVDNLNSAFHGNFMIRGYGQLGEVAPSWATTDAQRGMIPANSSVTIDVIFDSTGITQTGTYSASLVFDGTYVNEVEDMPLVMQLVQDDGDAVDNEIECDVSHDCDGNGDGMADDEQDNVTSLPNQGDDEGHVTILAPEVSSQVNVSAITAPITMPKGVDSMSQGVFDFSIEGLEQEAEVMLRIYIHNHATQMDGYGKHNEQSGE